MLRKKLLLGLLALSLSMPVLAQESTAMPELLRLQNTVQEVSAQVSADGTLELVISGLLQDGCEAESIVETERVGTAYFVDVYRNYAADAPCTRALLPFETTADVSDLLTLDADATLPVTLVVNDAIYRINYAQIEPLPNGSAPIVPPLFSDLVRTPATVTSVSTIHNEDGTASVRLQGTTNDSCQVLIARAYPSRTTGGEITIEAYSALDIADMCALGLVPFDQVLATGADIARAVTYRLYGIAFTPDPALNTSVQEFLVQQLLIESIQVALLESLPVQIQVTANGTIDGCPQEPALVVRQLMDNSVSLEALRIVPADQACTMIAKPLTLSLILPSDLFAAGELSIIVNNDLMTTITLP